MTSPLDALNAALHLEGLTLDGGWQVGPIVRRDPDSTGGAFSVAYTVTREDGAVGFMKVVNLARDIGDIDRLQATVNDYISERDILVMCGEERMSRVVTAISHGQFSLAGYPISAVNYLIFELADTDVRVALSRGSLMDVVLRLDLLRHLATGMRQLHARGVAHQDLKPSNFLIFSEYADSHGKVADLGRAYRVGVPSSHDGFTRPGDVSYAPPEQLYRYAYPEESVRRFSADLYQLGNLAAFMFSGATMNSLLSDELAAAHHWANFGDDYETALPYVIDAHARAIRRVQGSVAPEIAEQIASIISYLCWPDARRRGHPKSRAGSFSLDRVITEIDLLAKRTALKAAARR